MSKSALRMMFAATAALFAAGAASAACGSSDATPPSTDDAGGADALAPSDSALPTDSAVDVQAFADATAAPVVTVVASTMPDAIDFDLRPADVLYLRANPTRIDGCAGTVCTPVVDTAVMPPESATQTNASLAFLPANGGPGWPYVLIAQQGRDTCAASCTVDIATAPGLYSAMLMPSPPAAKRWTATVALEFAKSGRTTDGFLVGRGDTWAVAQVVSNEAPAAQYTTVYTAKVQAGLNSVPSVTLGRGIAPSTQPFVFAATRTPSSGGGYAATAGDLVDIGADGGKAGILPTHAAVTTIDPGAADVFARGTLTPDNTILSFHNSGALVAQAFPLPAMNKDASVLAATDRHVVFFGAFDGDGGKAVTMHACPTADVLAKTCTPYVLDLPLETIMRVRTSGSTVYILGKSAGVPRLVSVALP